MRAQQPWANETAWKTTMGISDTGHPFRYFWWMHTLERVYKTDAEAAHEWSLSMRRAWAGPMHKLFPLKKIMCSRVQNSTLSLFLGTPVFKLSNHHHLETQCAQQLAKSRPSKGGGVATESLFDWVGSGRAARDLLQVAKTPAVMAKVHAVASKADSLHWSNVRRRGRRRVML